MTGFTDVFGSMTIPSAESSYKYLNLVADQQLTWPAQSDGSIPELSSILKVSCALGNSLILPDARDQSPGFGFLVRNSGFYPLGIKDFSLGVVATLNPGGSYYVYLVDNSTAAGVYEFLAFGVGTSNVDSASLIGAGIKALGTSLNQSHPTQTYSSSQTVISSHRAQLLVFNGGSATLNLTSTSLLGDDFFFLLKNLGTGTIIIDPAGSETIDGQSSFTVQPGESLMVCASSASWFTVGYGRSLVYQFTQLVKDVSAGGTVTLTSSEAGNKLISFSGNPSSVVTVVAPAAVAVYYLSNTLSTSQSVTFKTPSGSGVSVPQGARIIAMCDGVNVVSAQSVQANSSVSLIDGTSAAPALSFSSTTNTGIYKQGSNGLGITVAGAALALFEAGAVTLNKPLGVGATPTGTQRLLVKQGVGDTSTVDLQGSSTNTSLRLVNDLNTVERAALVVDSSNVLSVKTNGVTRLTVDATANMQFGNNGISAAGAGRYFDIYNLENTNSASFSALRLITYNAAGAVVASGDMTKNKAGAFSFNNTETTASAYFSWSLNSAEKMRLESTGKLLLNYTTSQNSAKLQVSGTGYINNASAFNPANSQVTSAAMQVTGAYGGGYLMVDSTYHLGMYSVNGDLWFGLGSSAGLTGKATISSNIMKYFGSDKSEVQSVASNGWSGFTALASGTNPGYVFFLNGGGERGRIYADNNSSIGICPGSSGVTGFRVDSSKNTQSYGDQLVLGDITDATTRQKRLVFQSNIRQLYFCLNPDNSFALWDQAAGANRWISEVNGNITFPGKAVAGYLRANAKASPIGYDSGASVTQLTDKTTSVIINSSNGQIITADTILNSGANVEFTVVNNTVTNTDTVVCSFRGVPNAYYTISTYTYVGGFVIVLRNIGTFNLSEALYINFAVIHASNA